MMDPSYAGREAGHLSAFRRLLLALAVVLAIAVLAFGLAYSTQSAYASDPTPTATSTATPTNAPRYVDKEPPNWTPDPDLQNSMDKRQKLVDEYAQVTRGQISMAQYDTDLDAYYAGEPNHELHHPDQPQTAEECAAIPPQNLAYWSDGTCYDVTEESDVKDVPVSTPDTHYPYNVVPRHSQRIIWGVPQIPQNNSYYCGPAAAMEVLTFWINAYHEPNHSHFGDPLYQYELARMCDQSWEQGCDYFSGKFLMTEYIDWLYTPWRFTPLFGHTIYNMEYGMNRWRQGTEHGDYVPVGLPQVNIPPAPSPSPVPGTFHDRWITDIDAAFPMIFDATENGINRDRGVTNPTPNLPGHPTSRVIRHWFAVRGYSVNNWYGDGQEYVHFVDSVYGSSVNHTLGYDVSQPNNRIEVHHVYDMLAVDGYGYVW